MNTTSTTDTVFNFIQLYRLAMRSALKAHEIGLHSMHVKCLTYIERTEVCTANDIVRFFSRDKAQIARLIKEMIDKDWIQKTANPEDKRSQLLSLTENGKDLAELISATQTKVHTKIEENLTSQELAEFKRVADIMASNLKSMK
ncbi:MarR family winged helix-turn-helix transcriptional regulator [Vibrio algarum]|uniref:MarR family transcriptional regulator n=1 Tax=Vibrio algarum TaxID=3020714 RepID=A0ABT4YUB0_9VIBR|nr:MarR family transcriptional regulator [Vibrio sp. KJ40-1]MDB1125164.1 MarR family transcriptional regulator [Vibrio sp. KJ40-1]